MTALPVDGIQIECGACQRMTPPEVSLPQAMCAWLLHVVDEHPQLIEALQQTTGDHRARMERLAELFKELRR